MMLAMTTHLAVSKVLLVADPRNVSTGPEAVDHPPLPPCQAAPRGTGRRADRALGSL